MKNTQNLGGIPKNSKGLEKEVQLRILRASFGLSWSFLKNNEMLFHEMIMDP